MSHDTRSLASTRHYGAELPGPTPPAISPPLAPLMPRMRRVAGTLELLRAVIRQHEIAQHRWRAPDPDDADDPAAREGLLRAAVMLRGVRERLTADFIEQAAEALGLP